MAQKSPAGRVSARPPAIVYKTKKPYNNLVPVLLSEDRSEIVSYPDPTDVYYHGKLAYPTRLKRGYLLDNRGIGPNVAFLKLTYQEYAKLPVVPKRTDLYAMIIDRDPLKELYRCGDRAKYQSIVSELNKVIKAGKLSQFDRLK